MSHFLWFTVYIHYRGLLPPNGILPHAKFTLHPSPILAALLRGTRAVGASQTLRHDIFMRQGSHPVRHWAVELSSFCINYMVSVS